MGSAENNNLINLSDVLNLWRIFRRNFLIIFIIPLLFGLFGYYYTYNMTEFYGAQTQILIKNDETYNYQQNIYQSLGYYEAYQNMANQIRVIKSREIIARTLERLDYDVSFFIEGRLKTEEEVDYIPFRVDAFEVNNKKWYNQPIYIDELSHSGIQVHIGEEDQKQSYTIPFLDTTSLDGLKIFIRPSRYLANNLYGMQEINYYFKIYSKASLVSRYQSRISVENEENTSILSVEIQDELPKRAVQLLDTLTTVYIDYSLESKFKINENTLKFIDRQLDEIIIILSGIEDTLDRYKSNNAILDLPKESEEYFEKMISMDEKKREWKLMLNDLNKLEDYIESLNTQDEKVLPSSYYISEKDDFLQQALKELYTLQIKKNATQSSATKQNIRYRRVVDEIDLMKEDILVYISNSKKAIINRIRGFAEQVGQYQSIIKQMPQKERGLLKINRRLQVNEKMYLYLLEKKANTIIAKAGIVSETKVIEKARSTGLKSPNKLRYIIIFVVVGIAVSGLYVFIKELFYRKIKTLEELERLTSLPILGQVYHLKNYSGIQQIIKQPKSRLAEAFRSIRAKIAFMKGEGEKANKILISSIGPGEGKTFNSINMAIAIAQANKKVLLVELDMHKPRIYKAFGEESVNGLSAYLSGKSTIDEIIKSSKYENLDLALCGAIPPNPSDLLELNSMKQFFSSIEQEYDYVIVDTPPIGLISDTLVLQKYVDVNVFVLNTRYSRKREVDFIEKIVEENNLKNVGLVLNGVKVSKWRYYYAKYGYGYSYGYGYGYGYGHGYLDE